MFTFYSQEDALIHNFNVLREYANMRMILTVKVHVYQKVGFEMVRLIALMDGMRNDGGETTHCPCVISYACC